MYAKADFQVDTEDKSIDEVAEEVISLLNLKAETIKN